MTTPVVTEIKRLSPHATRLVGPAAPAPAQPHASAAGGRHAS